jgi:hypothetical protein
VYEVNTAERKHSSRSKLFKLYWLGYKTHSAAKGMVMDQLIPEAGYDVLTLLKADQPPGTNYIRPLQKL